MVNKTHLNNASLNNTCILYFTTGNRGVKSFSSKTRKSDAIQRLLFSRTLAEIRKSKLDYKISDGANYGTFPLEKLNGAVTAVFASGYESVIIVGDDTPQLSSTHLKKATVHLQNQHLCVGPSKDGGTYLIAFKKSDFDNGILNNLNWHSEHFLDELLTNCALTGHDFEFLPKFGDIDSAVDLFAFIAKASFASFTKLLKNILQSFEQTGKQALHFFTIYFENCIDRGPPRFIFKSA